MAVIQLGNDNSADKASWRFDRESKQKKIIFIDSKRKGYIEAHTLQAMGVRHKI